MLGDSQLDRARLLAREGKLAEAEAALRRLATKSGASGETLAELASLLRLRGQKDAAEQFAMMALARAKSGVDLHAVGTVLDALGKSERAIEAFTRATAINDADGGSWNGLGLACVHAHKIDEAIAALEKARELRPRDTVVLSNLAWAWSLGWRLDEAVDAMRAVIREEPGDLEARKLVVFLLNYTDRTTPREVFEEHRAFGPAYAELVQSTGVGTARPEGFDACGAAGSRGRPLRVGLLSPDLREHPVARFVEPLLAHHDRAELQLIGCPISRHADATTQRLKSLADGWLDLSALGELEAVKRLRQEKLDVLVDLAGHTSGARPGILVLRGAPRQVTYLGYPNTTGLPNVDARLIDAITDPDGAEEFATERLVRLEPCFLCFEPTAVARRVPARPVVRASAASTSLSGVTFGSFNTLRKLTPRLMEAWAMILSRVPDSRLLLKNSGVGSVGVAKRVVAALEAAGIDSSRVELLGRMASEEDHYRTYHRVDIALDTSPYNGTTTTCDALWMGVPVVTMLGDRHVSRVTASLLHAVGAPELVARDIAEYVEKAVALAGDGARRAMYHGELRGRMERGVLCDGARFAREFARAMREVVALPARAD